MRPVQSAFTLCLVIALAATAWGQYGDSSEGQSGSVSEEDETGGDDTVTEYSGGYESAEDDADTGTTMNSVLSSDQRYVDESGVSSEAPPALPRIIDPLSNHIFDDTFKNPDEGPVQLKQPYDYSKSSSLGEGDDSQDSDDLSSKDDDNPSLRGKEFDYIRKLRKMVDWQTVFKQSSPLIQNLIEEKGKLRMKLREMESERIKLRAILSQLKRILSEMHERSPCSATNMTSHEIRIARLRNLFLILGAITNFTPLTHEQLAKFNYDVGLFDPKITEESKTALVQRIATLLRNKFALNHLGESDLDEIQNSFPSITLRPDPAAAPSESPRSTLETKLRRLRNIYLLVRPLVTGVKLTSEELRELWHSRDGYFEPGLNDSRKIEIITRIAENIRTSHLSQKLLEESRLHSTPSTSIPAPATTENPTTSTTAPTPYSQNSVLLIRMTPKRDEENVHVSGKIQMDLNIEGDINPNERGNGLLSKLI